MHKKLLYRFFEGSCSPSEIEKVRAWVSASPENEKVFFEESALFDAMQVVPYPVELPNHSPNTKWILFTRELLKIAAIILLVLSGVATWQYIDKSACAQALNTIEVPAGKSANVTLSDGSKVWLNARSTLRYPSVFEKNERNVFLEGEAYFEVSADKKNPFTVHTEAHDIRVFGTSFHVEVTPERFSVALMEGSLKVCSSVQGQETLLTPGHMVYMKDGKLRGKEITDYNPYRWREGLICFDNIHFPELMDLFEKYYAVKIKIDNTTVNDYVCTGKFRQSDGIDYALNILRNDVRFTYVREEDTNIIHIK